MVTSGVPYELQEAKLQQVIKASGNTVEGYWPGLFAKALKGQDITKLLSNVGSGAPAAGGAAPAGGDAGAGADGGAGGKTVPETAAAAVAEGETCGDVTVVTGAVEGAVAGLVEIGATDAAPGCPKTPT